MKLEDVVRCSTHEPAKQLGIEGAGTLRTGTSADISIMKLEDRAVKFIDKDGVSVSGKQTLIPKGTVIDGKLLYRAVDLYTI